ncbi:SpoIIE family protein phosphatase [Nonomuraea sp. NPDC050790]|uniref:SpoIIE family protein phosphatase n=1 Tax=Nonomuraea sp. NPDC050790 TaxID=3364371 RepID=UPI0037B3B621
MTSDNVGRLAATIGRLREQITRAQHAAEGRALLEMAKGILVERLQCGPTEAALQLHALAERAGLKPLELAADLINQAAQDRLTQVAHDLRAAGTPPPSVAVRLREAESGVLGATDSQRVAESLLEHALTPLGATAVALWAAGADASLTLAAYAGHSAEEARRWRYVPPGVATPARRALVERRAVWFTDLARAALPTIGHRPADPAGRVVVPAGTGGRILGVLEISWPYPLEEQPPAIHRQIEALAELCAHTLEERTCSSGAPDHSELVELADSLADPALLLRPELDEDGRLADFRIHHANARFADPAGRPRTVVTGTLLLEAYPAAAEEHGLFEKIEHVYATGETFKTDRMTLTAQIENVPLTSMGAVSITRHGGSVLMIWRVRDESLRLAGLLQHAQRLGRVGGFEEDVQTGEITWNAQLYEMHGLTPGERPIPLEFLREYAHPDDATAIGRFLRAVLHHRRADSVSFRLRRPDGSTRHIRVIAEPVFGDGDRLLAIRGAYQDISAQHWTEVALAATRDQLAHSEQRAAERNRLTLQLQHAIMPPAQGPVEAFGLDIAVRYRPAEEVHLVGGDWYDAVVLPSKKVLLSLGDVAGHGIEAATGMVVLRNALRGLATTGAGPAQLMTWLNLVTHHLTDRVTATAVCCLYDSETRVLQWARAGHLPPVLVRGGRAAELPMIDGLMLGVVAETGYVAGTVQLERDDVLLLYTDGLIERRDITLEQSQEHLLSLLSRPDAHLEHTLDRLLTHSNSDTDDDTCLIGVAIR